MLFLYVVLCIHVTLYVLAVSPLLRNVDVMISTLQKRLQDALLSLVGPLSSFRIGSHLGHDILLLLPPTSIDGRARRPAPIVAAPPELVLQLALPRSPGS